MHDRRRLSAQTVRDLFGVFWSQPWKGKVRYLTEKRRRLELFAEKFGDYEIAALAPAELLFWVTANPDWGSDWTKRNVIVNVRHPFTWAAKLRLIDHDPFVGVSWERGPRGRPMSDEEFERILEATDEWFHSPVLFMRITGCRTSEAADLEWSMIDWGRGCALIAEGSSDEGKTTRSTRKSRILVLSSAAIELLRKIRSSPDFFDRRWVFINKRRRTKWTRYSLATKLKRLRKKLGIPLRCRLYGLRHRYGTQGVKRGENLKVISELMGHASVRTTEIYVHMAGDIEHLKSAAERMAE